METTASTAPPDAVADDTPTHASRGLVRLTNWLLGLYLAAVFLAMVAFRVSPSVDVFAALVAIGAILAGRGRSFIRDWGPFVLIFMAWEAMRGVANAFGQAVQSDSVIGIERFLFFGHIPSVDLQRALHVADSVQVHDVALSFVYVSHFFFPLAVAFVLWLKDRTNYYRFVATLMAVSFAAFLTFLLVPVAPPRFASQYGEALPIVDIMSEVSRSTGWQGFSWVYRHIVGNPVAAFPSMHAAYPLLVFLFLQERSARLALAWLPFVFIVWFATVYLGHHYVVDVIGGALYAWVGYVIVRKAMVHQIARAG